jgi:hypothetical protein
MFASEDTFLAFCGRQSRRYEREGIAFSDTLLAPQFIPYFNSQQRIRVKFQYGLVLTGRVGVTSGWVPVFLLMRTSRSIGSEWTLSASDVILAVHDGRTYCSTRPQTRYLAYSSPVSKIVERAILFE